MSGNLASALLDIQGDDRQIGIWNVADFRCAPAASPPVGDLLLYGFDSHLANAGAICPSIMEGWRPRIVPAGKVRLAWTNAAGALATEVAGLQLELEAPTDFWCSFANPDGHAAGWEVLASLDGRPWFLRTRQDGRWIYLLGAAHVPDPDVAVSSAAEELPLVSVAIAYMLFVRAHYPAHAWRPAEHLGNFIIDDPLLRPVYGFVRHAALASQVRETRGAATIAFIPWNARRTAEATAALYRRGEGLSICVHGCEHIDEEFSRSDADDLRWRATAALENMRLHESLTGVPFEPVMVFPQGRFCREAIGALEAAGFLAAANSTFLAVDGHGKVRLRHLLAPAVMAYGSLPLFRRRSPAYVDRFRYDAILGKPLLLVEHHGFFRDSGAAFRQVFSQVRERVPGVRWAGLGEIARRTRLIRHPATGRHEVTFYSRQLRFRADEPGIYTFRKIEQADDIQAVHVDGRPVEFRRNGDVLQFEAVLEPTAHDTEVLVDVRRCDEPARRPARRRRSRLAVAVRRYLSEGRDNYVATNRTLRALSALGRRPVQQQAVPSWPLPGS